MGTSDASNVTFTIGIAVCFVNSENVTLTILIAMIIRQIMATERKTICTTNTEYGAPPNNNTTYATGTIAIKREEQMN